MEFTAPLSRNEAILQNILGANNTLVEPQSRIEAILQAILYDEPYTDPAMSRIEELLLAIKNGGTWDKQTISRNEAILKAKLNSETYEEEPQSRIEELLIEWCNSTPTGILKEVSGALITVTDALARAAEELVIEIKPVQSGTGDPSPTNIRPITGFTGLTLTKTGANLLDTSRIELGTFNQSTGEPISGSGNQQRTTYYIKVNEGQKIVNTNAKSENCRAFFFLGSAYISTALLANNTPTTVPNGVDRVYISSTASGWTGSTAPTWAQIEIGATATPYTAYNGNIYNVSWQTEAGTVYGGTLDVVSGVLTVTWTKIDMGSLEWGFVQPSASIPYGTFYANTTLTGAVKLKGLDNIICDMYKNSTVLNVDKICRGNASNDIVYAVDSSFNSDIDAFVEAVTGHYFCYELATPVAYQLTPTEVMMLTGTNNIWADTGDCTLKYWGTEEPQQLSLGNSLGDIGLSMTPDINSDSNADIDSDTDSDSDSETE